MLALVKGIREPHEVKKTPFDLDGNRTHDLWIRSTFTLPTELRGRTEKEKKMMTWQLERGRYFKGHYYQLNSLKNPKRHILIDWNLIEIIRTD